FLLLMIPCCIYAQDNLSALIPMPNKVTSDSDMVLVLENQVNCYIETDSLEFELNTLSSIFNKRFGINVKRSTESSKSVVQLLIDKSLKTKEHYQLSVNEKRLVIKGATSAAVFYGLMTLDQILAGD
ncbi:glycoside hydrolase family 20 zincin-like fold domain-containing protein, partial [Bacteroides ovatus]